MYSLEEQEIAMLMIQNNIGMDEAVSNPQYVAAVVLGSGFLSEKIKAFVKAVERENYDSFNSRKISRVIPIRR